MLTAAETSRAVMLAFQVLDSNLEINGSGKMKAVAKLVRGERAAVLVSRKASLRGVPLGLTVTRVLLSSILYSVSCAFEKNSLCEICRHLS